MGSKCALTLPHTPLTHTTVPPQLQTACPIPKGWMVTYFGGTAFSGDVQKPHGPYVVKFKTKHVLVYLDGAQGGTVANYVNHSCSPNCELYQYVCQNTFILGLVTAKPVKAMEFLSFNYGGDFQYIETCLCGSSKCRDKDRYAQWLSSAPLVTYFSGLPPL